MRLDINIAAGGPPEGDGSAAQAAQLAVQMGHQMGHLLARMEFDYPTQMIAMVKVDNGDGTYDCDRPGTSIYMSRVETISAVLAQRIAVGMTVLIRFFRRDRGKPYIVRVTGGLAQELENLGWVCSRANWKNNFSAGESGEAPSISSTPAVFDDMGVGVILGILHPLDGALSVKSLVGLNTGLGYNPLYYADPTDYAFLEQVTNLATLYQYATTFCNWAYVEELDALLWVSAKQFSPDTTQVVLIHAGTGGASSSSTPVTDGSAATPWAIQELSMTLTEGLSVCLSYLFKTYHAHGYSHTYSPAATTDSSSENERSIVALALPDLTVAWRYDVNKVWTGSYPPPHLSVIDKLAYGRESLTGTEVLAGQHAVSQTVPWPVSCGNCAALLPGHPGVVLEGDTLGDSSLVIPVTGRVACTGDYSLWSNPTYPAYENRYKAAETGQQVSPGGVYPSVSVGCWFPRYQVYSGTYGPGGSLALETDGYPHFGPAANSKTLHAWLVALNCETGSEAWKYEFPELDPTEHYFVDTDSFDKVAASPMLAAWDALPYGQWGAGSGTSGASSDVIHPDQIQLSSVGVPTELRTYAADGSALTDYLYWPNGARYYFDPQFWTNTGDNAETTGAHGPSRAGNVVADSDGNIYAVWLQPKIIISCAAMWHRSDATIDDRTHNPIVGTPYNTLCNGYESDRLTLIPDHVDVWAVINTTGIGPPVYAATFYGVPNKYTMFRSFLGKWNSSGDLQWSQELTSWHDETIDDSPGLDGELPYPGVTLRICPTSAGIFVLRLVRLPIQTTLREQQLLPHRDYRTEFGQVRRDFAGHTKNCKAILELRDAASGEVTWSQDIFDPTAYAPIWLCGCAMFSQGTTVFGRVDWSTDYNAETLWMEDPPDYSGGLTRHSWIFRCDSSGNMETREADTGDPDSLGCFPYDFTASLSHDNGRVRQLQSAMVDGTLYYPVGPTDFEIWSI